jgi:NTP pyrophosphatase (non-canonical NTP hydrolase)
VGIGKNDSIEKAVESEKFDVVADVLNALQEHDEELVDIIREIKERKGAGKPFNPRRLTGKVKVIGPRVDLDRLTESIEVEIADRIGSSWDEWFGLLMRFKAREGHCRVPTFHIEGTSLGRWAARTAQYHTLSADLKDVLDDIGFVWNPLDISWEEGFAALKKFKARKGDCRVPQGYVEGSFTLGTWTTTQRIRKKENRLSNERIKRLEEIGFIWDPFEYDWEQGFAALKKFMTREAHCRAPISHIEGTYRLGRWIGDQREKKDMSAEHRKRLDAIGFAWDPLEGSWEKYFMAFTAFKAREGHCLVPARHVEGTLKLGQWVSNQRKQRDALSAERKQRLDAIGFAWDPLESSWEKYFVALTAFKAREGHCLVPARHVEGTLKLGKWVSTQRQTRDTMSAERIRRLDAIGFVWDPLESSWEKGFAALKKFKTREGHCLMPINHIEEAFKLGQWVSDQRTTRRRDFLSAERIRRLDAIGFVWDQLESSWEKGFAALKKFKARERHCLVPLSHVEGTFNLGKWVARQRRRNDRNIILLNESTV